MLLNEVQVLVPMINDRNDQTEDFLSDSEQRARPSSAILNRTFSSGTEIKVTLGDTHFDTTRKHDWNDCILHQFISARALSTFHFPLSMQRHPSWYRHHGDHPPSKQKDELECDRSCRLIWYFSNLRFPCRVATTVGSHLVAVAVLGL
eukprot:scaffold181730_cov45-Attheya_sp.AAC.2